MRGCECELEYPALARLFSLYLHGDWPDEYASDWEAAEAFVTLEPALARRLPGEVELTRARLVAETDLVELLVTHLGCAYWPYPSGISYGQWLDELAEYVSARLAVPGEAGPSS